MLCVNTRGTLYVAWVAMDKQVSFQAVCHLLEHLSRISKKDVKKQKLQIYIDVSEFL